MIILSRNALWTLKHFCHFNAVIKTLVNRQGLLLIANICLLIEFMEFIKIYFIYLNAVVGTLNLRTWKKLSWALLQFTRNFNKFWLLGYILFCYISWTNWAVIAYSYKIILLNHLFRCYEMEKRLKTPDLFKFPFFEAICWFVAKNLMETLKGN